MLGIDQYDSILDAALVDAPLHVEGDVDECLYLLRAILPAKAGRKNGEVAIVDLPVAVEIAVTGEAAVTTRVVEVGRDGRQVRAVHVVVAVEIPHAGRAGRLEEEDPFGHKLGAGAVSRPPVA